MLPFSNYATGWASEKYHKSNYILTVKKETRVRSVIAIIGGDLRETGLYHKKEENSALYLLYEVRRYV